jgi:CDP-glucose 4,6-dehydratase
LLTFSARESSMMRNNILLTGASGFTGSWLAEHLLDAGAHVATILADANPDGIFVRTGLIRRVRCVEGSILDFDLVVRTIAECEIDTVFHLAAVSVERKAFESPRVSFEVNIRGTYHVLEACRLNMKLVKKVVVASSDKVYGDNPCLPYREEMPVQGMNPYDASKACGDLIARSYHQSYNLPVTVARFANIYGGGDLNWSRLVPNTIRCLLQDERPLVRTPPEGVYKRDFLYIKDQIRAYIALFKAMDRPEVWGQAYNFGSGHGIGVPEMVARIQRLMHRENVVPSVVPAEHREILHQQLQSEKANKEVGWFPTYSIDEGLIETIQWYTEFLIGSTNKDRT